MTLRMVIAAVLALLVGLLAVAQEPLTTTHDMYVAQRYAYDADADHRYNPPGWHGDRVDFRWTWTCGGVVIRQVIHEGELQDELAGETPGYYASHDILPAGTEVLEDMATITVQVRDRAWNPEAEEWDLAGEWQEGESWEIPLDVALEGPQGGC